MKRLTLGIGTLFCLLLLGSPIPGYAQPAPTSNPAGFLQPWCFVLACVVSVLLAMVLVRNWTKRSMMSRLNRLIRATLAGKDDSLKDQDWGNDEVAKMADAVQAYMEGKRQLKINNSVLNSIARGHDLSTILAEIVKGIAVKSNKVYCSILLWDREKQRLSVGAGVELPEKFNKLISEVRMENPGSPCAVAMVRGQTVIADNIPNMEEWAGFQPFAEELGMRACWSEPILSSSGIVLGTLSMYFEKPIKPSDDDLNLIKSYADLAAIAIERNRAEQEIIRSMKMAQQANGAKTEFLSHMSHEFRTPLNAILGFSQLMKTEGTDNLNSSQKENLQHVIKAGRHLLELVNEILDLSKIESGKVELNLEDVSMKTVLDEACSLIRPLAREQEITLVPRYDNNETTYVHADFIRLKQVLFNILSNAVKYNRAGGSIQLDMNTDSEKVYIKVTDTGRGIPAENLKDIFQPFNRFGIDQGHIEGTGIGLAITQRLTESMNGTIHVDSTVGRGSCFTLEFPLVHIPLHGGPSASPNKDLHVG